MDATRLVSLLASIVSLLALWFLYSKLYRDYRIDLARERLFSLRDELFELGASGKISFDDDAYGLLRSTINGFIRFVHRLNFLSTLFLVLRIDEEDVSKHSFFRRFSEAMNELQPEIRTDLLAIHQKVHYVVLSHLVATSPSLFVVVALSFPVTRLLEQLGKVVGGAKTLVEWCRSAIKRRWSDMLDSAALEVGVA